LHYQEFLRATIRFHFYRLGPFFVVVDYQVLSLKSRNRCRVNSVFSPIALEHRCPPAWRLIDVRISLEGTAAAG
jgi:hypothetical protein